MRKLWRMPCGGRVNRQSRVTWFFWLLPAQVLISSRVTSTAVEFSKRPCIHWLCLALHRAVPGRAGSLVHLTVAHLKRWTVEPTQLSPYRDSHAKLLPVASSHGEMDLAWLSGLASIAGCSP